MKKTQQKTRKMKKDILQKIEELKKKLDKRNGFYRWALVDEKGKIVEKYRCVTLAQFDLKKKQREYFCKLKIVRLE